MCIKKTISLIMAMVLLFSVIFTNVASADTISKEKISLMIAAGEIPPQQTITEDDVNIKRDQAIETAKAILEDEELFELGNTYLYPGWSAGANSWNIDFYSRSPYGGNANVSINADTGEVTGFNIWEGYDGKRNFIAKITRSEAREIAEQYLKDKFGLDISLFLLKDDTSYMYYQYNTAGIKQPITHSFSYVKSINGIPVNDYGFSIAVDAVTGKITSYYNTKINIELDVFPSVNGILTPEEAIQNYIDSLDFKLQYITFYGNKVFGNNKQNVKLAYVPVNYFSMLDASTGKALSYDGTLFDTKLNSNLGTAQKYVPIDPEAVLLEGSITREDAEKLAEGYKTIAEELLGVTFDNYSSGAYVKPYYNGPEGILNFSWYMYNDKFSASFDISISERTGHLVNINMSKYNNDYELALKESSKQRKVKEKISWEQGKEQALEILKKLVPGQYGFYTDMSGSAPVLDAESNKYVTQHHYNFTRLVNNLLFNENIIGISIDRETGYLNNFYFAWSDLEFPSTSDIISVDDARKVCAEGIEANLSYFFTRSYDKNTQKEIINEVPALAYTFSAKGSPYSAMNIDATTGKIIDFEGREIEAEALQEQFPEHWSKRSVELLAAQGIITYPVKEYDAELCRMDIIRMLSLVKGISYYTDYGITPVQSFTDVLLEDADYYLVENAVKHGILTDTGKALDGSEKITKEEFAVLMTNMLGYSDIAKYGRIFALNGAKNVKWSSRGSVAICSALDILPVGNSKEFDGTQYVTFAEAASALYKALEFVK